MVEERILPPLFRAKERIHSDENKISRGRLLGVAAIYQTVVPTALNKEKEIKRLGGIYSGGQELTNGCTGGAVEGYSFAGGFDKFVPEGFGVEDDALEAAKGA